MSFHRRDHEGPVFADRAPHFFKIIFADGSLRHEKLRIPKRFIRKHGEGLSNLAILKLPTGAKWEVQLTKSSDGGVWLQNGWQDFAGYYSLDHGHLLLFRYEGNSHFKVLIFDKSATEIDYPGTSDEEFQIPETEVTEISDDVQAPRPRVREKSPLPCLRPHKMMRTNSSGKSTACISNLQTSVAHKEFEAGHNFQAKESVRRISTIEQWRQKSKNFRRKQTLVTPMEKTRALERASAFSSENPFFKAVMQPSYIHGGGGNLNIPYKFAEKYISEEDCGVTLRTSDGRSWYSKCRLRVMMNGSPRAELCQGWKAFSRDNNLKVGDVCIFEVFKGVGISMKVVIFRVTEDANRHQSSGKLKQVKGEENTIGEQITRRPSSSRAPRALEAASELISDNPFHLANIGSACLSHGCLNVPRSFTEKCIEQRGEIVRLQVGDKTWPVKMLLNSNTAWSGLSAGWTAFARENTLHKGDVCVFELINKKRDDVVLKVSIFRR